MTNNCIKVVEELDATNEVFNSLSAEQLIYAAIKGTSLEDVEYVFNEFKKAEEER